VTLLKLKKRQPATADELARLENRLHELKRGRDIAGLIELLRRTAPGDKKHIHEALRELTGKDFGTKARLWKRWLDNNRHEALPANKMDCLPGWFGQGGLYIRAAQAAFQPCPWPDAARVGPSLIPTASGSEPNL
jgi:hypothetical protein